jgi:hypothetical protein
MTTLNANAKPRRTLASQLDRMDIMLDGLSEALNESVATAVKDSVGNAVRQALQIALIEVRTSPEMVKRLQDLLAPAPFNRPLMRSWQERLARFAHRVTGAFATARQRIHAAYGPAQQRPWRERQMLAWFARLGGIASRERLLSVLLLAAARAGQVANLAAQCASRCFLLLIAGARAFWAALRAHGVPWLRRTLAACKPGTRRRPEDSRA